MAVTDLTGTTWYFNDTLSIDSEQNHYYKINFTTNEAIAGSYTQFIYLQSMWQGYLIYGIGDIGGVTTYSSSAGGNEDCRTINITSGEDVTNAELISWLEANAVQVLPDYIDKVVLPSEEEYNIKDTISGYLTGSDLVAGTNISIEETSEGQLEISSTDSGIAARIIKLPIPTITDLTGTTGLINSAPDVSSSGYVDILFSYGAFSRVTFAIQDRGLYYYSANSSIDQAYLYGTGWGSEAYRTVTFSGNVTSGDISNDEFIEGLLANATQVS